MQVNKQQILKLLNLDAMIDQYMRQPQYYRRQTTANNMNNKNKMANKHKTHTYQSNNKLASTLPADTSDGSRRTYSVKSIQKKTLDNATRNKDHIPLAKTQSSRMSTSNKSKCPVRTQWQDNSSANYQSTRVISTVVNQFNQSNSFIKATQFKIAQNNKTDNVTTQTNIADTIDNTCTLQNFSNNHIPKKQKVKLRLPNYNLQRKCEPNILKGRYQLEKLIGRGLSGEVYKARDVLSERLVAIKIIDINNVEYQFIKQLQHPNMIKYYNSFIQEGKRYIVLQYLPKSLSQVVRKRKLNQGQVKKIFKAISSGLLYLHSLSYAHRDIKLDNIVASDDLETVKFIDFGLCIDTAQSDAKQMQRFCGTTSYMAPEVISSKCTEPKKADIWSLGVALYILAVGRNPFVGKQQMEIFNKIKNNKTLFPPEMSDKLKNLLCSMLNKRPEDRPSIYEIFNNQWMEQ